MEDYLKELSKRIGILEQRKTRIDKILEFLKKAYNA
jgi:hypothetical protein